jgi:hypothetical protein
MNNKICPYFTPFEYNSCRNGAVCYNIHLTKYQFNELKRQEIENNRQMQVKKFIDREKELLEQKIKELNNIFDQELLNLEYEHNKRMIEKKRQENKLLSNQNNEIKHIKNKHTKEKKDHNMFWNTIGSKLSRLRNNKNISNITKIKPIIYHGIYKQRRWNASTLT